MPDPRDLPSGSAWTRRRFALASAALGLGASLGSASMAQARVRYAAEGPAPEPHVPWPSTPQRILLAGDSMIAGGFGLFLERALQGEHGFAVTRRGKTSSGLARPDFFDWLAEARRLVVGGPYPVNVVMFGGNDVQGLYMGRDTWIRWQEDGWDEEYARRVDALCDILAPGGERVFWVGLPVMRPPKFQARVEQVNAIYRERMAVRPGASFIDTSKVLADEDGRYADRIVLAPPPAEPPREDGGPLPIGVRPPRVKKVRVRAGDGIHLSPAGAHHLKAYALAILLPDLAGL